MTPIARSMRDVEAELERTGALQLARPSSVAAPIGPFETLVCGRRLSRARRACGATSGRDVQSAFMGSDGEREVPAHSSLKSAQTRSSNNPKRGRCGDASGAGSFTVWGPLGGRLAERRRCLV